jgi:2-succinyl-6-hydroxy-2,4-cyclohexadiene-1-carboxylate synthase
MSDWQRYPGHLAGWTRGEGRRLVFVHGFTQTSASWKPIANEFADRGYESIVVDAPGHGQSADIRADLVETAAMLTSMCGRAVYAGYSMGGRLCMHAAVAQPDLVSGLALVGASPGIADAAERAARRAADDELANHIEGVGVEAFLGEWLAQPLFARLVVGGEQRADRLGNSAAGLASSLRLAGTGAQDSLWPRLGEMSMPVLTVAGELDVKFATIGRQIDAAVPSGRFEEIARAGHAAHLEDPDGVFAVLQHWLQEIDW